MNPAGRPLGQHFLKNSSTARKIVEWARIAPADFVLEIGPGRGALTDALLEQATFLYAVEVDSDLAGRLQKRAGAKLRVEHADILKFDFSKLAALAPRWVAIGNLPYRISTRILQRIVEHRALFDSFTFMSQKEVAARVAAEPGSKDYGYLSCLVCLYASVAKGPVLPPGAFVPAPKVVSQLVRLEFLAQPRFDVRNRQIWDGLLRTAFRQRRKTLLNNLRKNPWFAPPAELFLKRLGLPLNLRGEQTSLEHFCQLANLYTNDA